MSKKNASKSAGKKAKALATSLGTAKLDAVPDKIDPRDWAYQPNLRPLPEVLVNCGRVPEVLDQETEGACTGFALAAVINMLLADRGSERRASPRMLYELARLYDEWPGEDYEGSSARGAIKAWIRHGVSTPTVWPKQRKGLKHFDEKVVQDALLIPGGAYYRIDPSRARDVHCALNETGAVYATLLVHEGWVSPQDDAEHHRVNDGDTTWSLPVIPERGDILGGHAVALVGYCAAGFIVQNSWGPDWGAGGFAIISYGDFVRHATDCWVAQLGVIAQQLDSASLHATSNPAHSALTLHNIRNHIVNIGNNGQLSTTGDYWTTKHQLKALVEQHIPSQMTNWQKPRVLLFIHGGLNNEEDGATRARKLTGTFLKNEIYPLQITWETGLGETLRNIVADWFTTKDRATGFRDKIKDARDWIVERSVAGITKPIWGEMRENAKLASKRRDGAMQLLLRHISLLQKQHPGVEVHLVAHSAGSIMFAHMLSVLAAKNMALDSVQLMAPAAANEVFDDQVLLGLNAQVCPLPICYLLSNQQELDDFVGHPQLYGKSLLYFVSNACMGYRGTPIIGIEKFFRASMFGSLYTGPHKKRLIISGAPAVNGLHSTSTSHGGFDNDAVTMNSVLQHILGAAPTTPFKDADIKY